MSQLTEKPDHATPNRLVPLKLLVLLFFGALQTMYAFLPSHMTTLGFQHYDIRLITLISALVSIIGPLIIGFILDRVSVKRPSAYGKWLRALLFVAFILAGLAFGSLLLVSKPSPGDDDEPNSSVTFSCNDNGGHLFVRKNVTINGECKDLDGISGELSLVNCSYTCETPEDFVELSYPDINEKVVPAKLSLDTSNVQSSEINTSDYDYGNLPDPEPLIAAELPKKPLIEPPHICKRNESNYETCHVYLPTRTIRLEEIVGDKAENASYKYNDDWCKHPLASTTCHIPQEQITWMKQVRLYKNQGCATPAVECYVANPFDLPSILRVLPRVEKAEEVKVQYDLYVTLRIIAELFPVIIHTLLNIAIIIATRETSVGRGNVGHQWAFYPIGVVLFATVVGLVNHLVAGVKPDDVERHVVPIATFAITCFVCAVVVLFSGKLPLTPSDWWWHTKCGMLAIPMSALKRYKWVITAITTIALILGFLWHVYESYRHLFSLDLIEYAIIVEHGNKTEDSTTAEISTTTVMPDIPDSPNLTAIPAPLVYCSKSFVYIIGALPAIPLIWNGEKIVDCFGHSNIFIIALVTFALRFAGLYFDVRSPFTTLYEILEPMSFFLPWFALLLFTRHLIPKKFLALGQALLVILFFALGRAIGFFYGTSIVADQKAKFEKTVFEKFEDLKVDNKTIQALNDFDQAEENDLMEIFTTSACVACVTAIVYFVVYHCILLPRYRVPTNRLAASNDANVSPQRVFHDERSRKGYFRY